MGINGAHSLTHSLEGLTLSCLLKVALALIPVKAGTIEKVRTRPVIDIDASWVAIAHSSKKTMLPFEHVLAIAKILCVGGFDVNIICDGFARHHSKRATASRVAIRQQSIFDAIVTRSKLMKTHRLLEAGTETPQTTNELKDQLTKLQTSLQKMESKIKENVDIGKDFYECLLKHAPLLPENPSHGRIEILRALFQADTLLARRIVHGESDITLAADSDLAALAGGRCLAIKQGYSWQSKTNSFTNATLFSGYYSTILQAAKALGVPEDSPRIKLGNYPVFDQQDDPRTRSLIAVAMGCDVYPKGLKGMGPASMEKIIQGLQPNRNVFSKKRKEREGKEAIARMEESAGKSKRRQKSKPPSPDGGTSVATVTSAVSCPKLIDELAKKQLAIKTLESKRSNTQPPPLEHQESFRAMLDALVDAFIYEPGVAVVEQQDEQEYKYMHDTPSFLPKHLSEFCMPCGSCTVQDGPPMLECAGPGTGKHSFLRDEGFSKCDSCPDTCVCVFCAFTINDRSLCFDCGNSEFAGRSDVPNNKATNKLLGELLAHGCDVPKEGMTTLEVHDFYDAVMDRPICCKDSIKTSAAFPAENSNFLKEMDCVSKQAHEMRDGGRFLRQDELTMSETAQLVSLLASLVACSEPSEATKKWKDSQRAHNVVSALTIDFALKSRVHSGHRLVKRSVRHGMDRRCPDVLGATFQAARHGNEVGLATNHHMRASMNQKLCSVMICFTESLTVSATCNCPIGSSGEQRTTCVHQLPMMFLLQMLLHDGLANHVLCELASDDVNRFDSLNSVEKQCFCRSLLTLQKAARLPLNLADADRAFPSRILESFTVGTSNFKPTPRPPNPAKLGPLRHVKFDGVLALAEKKKEGGEENAELASNRRRATPLPKFKPEFGDILEHHKAFKALMPVDSKDSPDDTSLIGNQTIAIRAGQHDLGTRADCVDHVKESMEIACDEERLTNRRSNQAKRVAAGAIRPLQLQHVNVDTEPPVVNEGGPADQTAFCARRWCCADGCSVRETSQTTAAGTKISFHKVPPSQKKLAPKTDINDKRRRTHAKKSLLREEWIRRACVSSPEHSTKKTLHLCRDKHHFERVKFNIPCKDSNGDNKTFIELLDVPVTIGEHVARTRNERNARPLSSATGIPGLPCRESPHKKPGTRKINPAIRWSYKCCYNKCNSTNLTPNVSFHKAPSLCRIAGHHNSSLQRKAIRKWILEECLRRLPLPTDTEGKMLFCSKHPIQTISRTVRWKDGKETEHSCRVQMSVPSSHGTKSPIKNLHNQTQKSKGLSSDRLMSRILEEADKTSHAMTLQNENELVNAKRLQTSRKLQKANDLQNNKELQKLIMELKMMEAEVDAGDLDAINDVLLEKTGLDVHQISKNSKKVALAKFKLGRNMRNRIRGKRTKVSPKTLNDKTVKEETGFRSLRASLMCVAVLGNGDALRMTESTTTSLTWFEQWYLFFEMSYGRSLLRWCDAERKYDMDRSKLVAVFDSKLRLEVTARDSWPAYASLAEDEALRDPDRWTAYKNRRVVMWDSTDFSVPKSENAEVQSQTFNSYYSHNCAKAGSGLQLCGWGRGVDLWVGAVTDTQHMQESEILSDQEKFQNEDLVEERDHTSTTSQKVVIPWTNILDKGYRVLLSSLRSGKQTVEQPAFARSDSTFTTLKVLRSGAVASDRAANERQVRLGKMCGFLRKGLRQRGDVNRYCDMWLGWTFRTNFMYEAVL